jgi:hypothetical protein
VKTPAVSVVIPTFNRRRQVEQAVKSVLSQTFGDLELLVVDGGDDGTAESLAGRDPRLRYERAGDDTGPSSARNVGIQLARAPTVAFLDADNRWLPDHLAVAVAVLGRLPEAVLVSTCPEFRTAGREEPGDAELVDPLPTALMWNRVGYVSGVAVRRKDLLEVGGFDEGLLVGEDDDLWLRLAMRGPFATLRRRTIVRRHTRNGLRDKGRRAGMYTVANTRSIERAIGELEQRPVSGRADLLELARARLDVLVAVGALEHDDRSEARAALRRACAAVPELERNPGILLSQIWKSAHDRAELRRRVAAAAATMPNPACHTALYLRAYAAVLCLTRGRILQAGRLVLRRPHLARRTFIAQAYRPGLRSAQKRVVEIIRGRRESPLAR